MAFSALQHYSNVSILIWMAIAALPSHLLLPYMGSPCKIPESQDDVWWPLATHEGPSEFEVELPEETNHLGFYIEGFYDEDHLFLDFERIDVIVSEDYTKPWDSGPLCGEEFEVKYKWQVSLYKNPDGSYSGTVRFHDCPGGGQVAYSVTGTLVPGENYLKVKGTKTGGAGDLYENSSETKYFILVMNERPVETTGP